MCVIDLVRNYQDFFKVNRKVLNKQLMNGEDLGLSVKSIIGKSFAFSKSYF